MTVIVAYSESFSLSESALTWRPENRDTTLEQTLKKIMGASQRNFEILYYYLKITGITYRAAQFSK